MTPAGVETPRGSRLGWQLPQRRLSVLQGRGEAAGSGAEPKWLPPPEYSDRQAWATILIASLFFYALIFPYRSFHLDNPVMVVMGLMLSAIAVKFAMDQFFLLLLLFSSYATFQKILPGDFGYFMRAFNLTNIFLAFFVLGLLMRARDSSVDLLRVRRIDIPMVTFAFFSSVSLVLGELWTGGDIYSGHVVFVLKRWLEPLCVYLVAVNAIRDRRDSHFLMMGVALVTALIGLRGVKEWYLDKGGLYGAHYGNIDRARIVVHADNPNQLGAYYCSYAFYLGAMALMLRKWGQRGLNLLGFILCGRAMLLTFSRGTTLAFAFGSVVLVLLWSRKAFLLILLPILVYYSFFPARIPGILLGRLSTTFRAVDPDAMQEPGAVIVAGAALDRSSVGRLAIWQYGMEIVKSSPLFGVGFGRFRLEIEKLTGGKFDSHNTYLTIVAEMGVPALALFLAMIWLYLREAIYVFRWSEVPLDRIVAVGYVSGVVAMAVSNFFGFRLNSNEITLHHWVMTAVIVRMAEFARAEREGKAA